MYAAGWLNDTELNRGYSGSDEKMNAITPDNRVDGSFDTGEVNHRVLIGMDYRDRTNNVTGYYGGFPPIDASILLMARSRTISPSTAGKSISCARPATTCRIRCPLTAGASRWVGVTTGERVERRQLQPYPQRSG